MIHNRMQDRLRENEDDMDAWTPGKLCKRFCRILN